MGTEVRLERFRDSDCAIGLLVVFQQRHIKPSQRRSRAVERVAIAILAVLPLETEVHSAGLVVLEIRAARYLEVGILAGGPDLDVVSFRGAKAHIAGAKHDHTVVESELLEDALGVGRERFEFGV